MKEKDTIIDNYVRGLLSKKEKVDFELMLKSNNQLQKEVQFRKRIINYFEYKDTLDIIQQAKIANENNLQENTEEDMEKTKNTIQQARLNNINRGKRIKIMWSTTISIAAMLLAFFWFTQTFTETTPYENSKLLTTLLIENPKIESVSGINQRKIAKLFAETNKSMKEEDYETVLAKLKEIRYLGIVTDEMLLHEMFVYYKTKDYKKAKHIFEEKILDKDTPTGNEARWYISWVYLEDGDIENTKVQLAEIKGHYQKQARQKLASL